LSGLPERRQSGNSRIERAPRLIASHGSSQSDVDLARLIANDIEDPASQPMIEELAEPLVAYARVALAQSAKKLFARGREHNRCGRGHALAFIKRPSARTQQWSVPATQQWA
jgi:hypothetical protein